VPAAGTGSPPPAAQRLYYFEGYDFAQDRVVRSRRPATRAFIERFGYCAVDDNSVEVDASQVDADGLLRDRSCDEVAPWYETSTCDGQAYADCRFGTCEGIPGTFFAQPILYQSSTTGCFFGDPSETRQGDFFLRRQLFGTTVQQLNQQCLFFNQGTVLGQPVPCKRGGFCVDCCIPAPGRSLIPVHSFDASLLGTPRFRLSK